MSLMTKNSVSAAVAPAGPTIGDIDAITVSPTELATALAGVGAVQGEVRQFVGTSAPNGWTVQQQSFPKLSVFTPGTTQIVGRRLSTAYDANAAFYTQIVQLGDVVYTIQNLASGSAVGLFESYNTVTGERESLPNYPLALTFNDTAVPALCAVPGFIIAFGGWNGGALSAGYRFNVATKLWEAIQSLPSARRAFSAARVGDYIYLFGGLSITTRLDSVVKYNWVTNAAPTTLALPGSTIPYGTTENPSVCVLPSGSILVTGGWNGAQILKYAVFNPTSGLFGSALNYNGNLATALGTLTGTATGAVSTTTVGANKFSTFVTYDEATDLWNVTAQSMPTLTTWAYGQAYLPDNSFVNVGMHSSAASHTTRTYLTAPLTGLIAASKD